MLTPAIRVPLASFSDWSREDEAEPDCFISEQRGDTGDDQAGPEAWRQKRGGERGEPSTRLPLPASW